MDSVAHFEIPVTDVTGEGSKFYSKVFGWQVEKWPGDFPYWMATTSEIDPKTRMPKAPGTLNGGIMEKEKIQTPVIVISVNSIEEKTKLIEENGGQMIGEKIKVGDMGWSAYFKDNSQNVMGLWQSAN